MTFGFPVVLHKGTERDVVCVVASGPTVGIEPFVAQLDKFGYKGIQIKACVRFNISDEHELTNAHILREGVRLVGSDFEQVCIHSSFFGESANLALLLQFIKLACPPWSAWLDVGIVWATGAVVVRDGRMRLGPVEHETFECKLAAFLMTGEPARILICPQRNWKHTCRKNPVGVVPMSLDMLSRRGSLQMDEGRKIVLLCEEYELLQLVQCIFPEIDVSSSNRFRLTHLPRIALSLSIVTIATFGVYQWVRSQQSGVQEASSQGGTIPEVESIPVQASSTSITLQAAGQPATSAPTTGIATTGRNYHPPRRPQSAARADIPTEKSGAAIPCSDVEHAIERLTLRRDHDCGITKSILPSEAQRCNREADEELGRLRLRMQSCKQP